MYQQSRAVTVEWASRVCHSEAHVFARGICFAHPWGIGKR